MSLIISVTTRVSTNLMAYRSMETLFFKLRKGMLGYIFKIVYRPIGPADDDGNVIHITYRMLM